MIIDSEAAVTPAPDLPSPWYPLDGTFMQEPGESKLPRPPIA